MVFVGNVEGVVVGIAGDGVAAAIGGGSPGDGLAGLVSG